MQLEYIDQFLAAQGLANPSLAVLRATGDRYDTMLLQPDSEVECRNDFIGNADTTTADQKHLAFFQLASSQAVHLAITPEYSTPWQTVKTLINGSIMPSDDALWVIGCEATTPAALSTFRQEHPSVSWIIPDSAQRGTRTFIDPLLYLFKTRTQAGDNKVVGLVQFKTQEMGGDRDTFLERNNLIKGDTVFILRNGEGSIYLLTLICSDALSFRPRDLKNPEQPHLILHIQLNPDPRHPAIQKYRKDLFDTKSDNKEVLCLNWARNIRVQGKTTPLNEISGSAIYTKSPELDKRDASVLSNHAGGLYLTHWKSARGYVLFLNYLESVFYFSSTRPSQTDAPPQTATRTSPQMISTFRWDSARLDWIQVSDSDSGVEGLCSQFDLAQFKRTAVSDNPLDFERLLTLSCGLITGTKWNPSPDFLRIFEIDDKELIFRVAFCQDPHPEASAFRGRTLNHLKALRDILAEPGQFPKTIADLAGNCEIKYVDTDAPANLFSLSSGEPAFVAYVGHEGSPADKRQLYDKMVTFCSAKDNARSRVVLWSHVGLNIAKEFDQTLPTVAKDLTEPPQSIVKDSSS